MITTTFLPIFFAFILVYDSDPVNFYALELSVEIFTAKNFTGTQLGKFTL